MINQVTLSGRIARPLETKKINTSKGEMTILDVCLACNGRKKEESYFFECVAFGSTADYIANYSKGKGGRLTISGALSQDSYTSKDGKKVVKTKITINDVEIVDFKESNPQTPQTPQYAQQAPKTAGPQAPQWNSYVNTIGGKQQAVDNYDENGDELPF